MTNRDIIWTSMTNEDKFDRKLENLILMMWNLLNSLLTSLDGIEEYYIYLTKADIMSLNRSKAVD